jgi:hypothetical protein
MESELKLQVLLEVELKRIINNAALEWHMYQVREITR